MDTVLCRICWNNNAWWKPDHAAVEHMGYYHDHGFGHEEWLFRYEWMLSGYQNDQQLFRYGFLEPFRKTGTDKKGKVYRVILYSHVNNDRYELIGEIRNAVVLEETEAAWAVAKHLKKGWIDVMRKELRRLRLNTNVLPDKHWNPNNNDIRPLEIVNVKFRTSDVIIYKQNIPLKQLKKKQINRYKPIEKHVDTVLKLLSKGNAASAYDRANDFDPSLTDDQRKKALAEIVLRSGQPAFRSALLKAYNSRCTVSGCDAPDVLEAAHILPYRNPNMNKIQNGLLLRSDIHTLFDKDLLYIDPNNYTISLHASLKGTTVWNEPWVGKKITLPGKKSEWPNPDALRNRVNI